ncbi:MAG: hypothetical protein PVF58_02015 [Candidatus Methanofastidiosia archaeon]|jgi:hypothetical protein
MDSVEIMLEEYKTLRQESLNAMNNRNTILSFGVAAIGAVFTGSIIAYGTNNCSHILSYAFILVIPAISIFILFMWFGEYERMQRVGKFLARIEKRINCEESKELLTWETNLRESKLHMKSPYYATIALLITISYISLGAGLYAVDIAVALKWLGAIIGALFHFILYFIVRSRILKLIL